MNLKRDAICIALIAGIFLLPINDSTASPPPEAKKTLSQRRTTG